MRLPQGGSGVTQKKQVTHNSLNLFDFLKAYTMQWMSFVQVYYVYVLRAHASTAHLYKRNLAYFHTQKIVFLGAVFYFLVTTILFAFATQASMTLFSSSNYKCTESYFQCIYCNGNAEHKKVHIGTKTPKNKALY